MDYKTIEHVTLEVFKNFNIKSFPIDCIAILKACGMKVESYSSQKPKKQEKCLAYSKDAFTLKKTVYYNDSQNVRRINFSLAHEIGHIALQHSVPRTEEHEKEADRFASYLLAPRMAIHYSKCKNHIHVSKQFGLSFEAASIAFDDYRRWHRKAVYKMNDFDKLMYTQFYNNDLKCFVYSIKKCEFCGKEIINDGASYCAPCYNRLSYRPLNAYQDENFRMSESHWLYGGF
jgi:hypothetical protein